MPPKNIDEKTQRPKLMKLKVRNLQPTIADPVYDISFDTKTDEKEQKNKIVFGYNNYRRFVDLMAHFVNFANKYPNCLGLISKKYIKTVTSKIDGSDKFDEFVKIVEVFANCTGGDLDFATKVTIGKITGNDGYNVFVNNIDVSEFTNEAIDIGTFKNRHLYRVVMCNVEGYNGICNIANCTFGHNSDIYNPR
jgi:hypothetical protein